MYEHIRGLDNYLEYSKESLFNHIEEHVLSYHVSLSSYLASPELLPPTGSGTFVKFLLSSHTIYGILTAAHVLKDLKFGIKGFPAFIGLSKLFKGDTISCLSQFLYIYLLVSTKGFYSNSNEAYRPDIAFITLGINTHPDHALLKNSSFYDLDNYTGFEIDNPQIASAFYRGAAPLRADGLLDTKVCIGGGESLKLDDETQSLYWQIPNTSNESIKGASGAGFWRFDCNQQTPIASLEGVVTSEDVLSYSSFEAVSPSFLYENFLRGLKDTLMKALPSLH